MQIEVKEIEYCKLLVSCNLDSTEVDKKRNEVVKIFKKAPVPGFRKGKSSDQAIKHHYRNQINESLKRALAEDALHQSMVENQIKPLGNPTFTEMFLQPTSFSCQFILHKKPEVELVDYRSLEVPKPHQPMTVEDKAQQMLQSLRMAHGSLVPFESNQFLQDGDTAVVSYEVTVDGDRQEELCSSMDIVVVGANQLPNFDTNLQGMIVGESRSFTVDVPTSAPNKYAGKVLSFTVTLHSANKTVPCQLDDSLAQKEGKPSLQELEKHVRDSAFSFVENLNKSYLTNAVIATLVNAHSIQIPDFLALKEAEYLAAGARTPWETLGNDAKEEFLTRAEKNVKLSLILDKVRETDPEAQLSEEETYEIMKQNLGKLTDKPVETFIKELNSAGYLQALFNRILDEYTIDHIVKNVKVIE